MSNEFIDEVPVPDASVRLTYSSYLKVSDILKLQKPLSQPAEHDETLFIIIHQAYELWFKQMLHEVEHCEQNLTAGKLQRFTRTLGRVATIMDVLVHQIDILETMSPTEFNLFRDNLNPASGFQSWQFRIFETRLGSKNPAYLKFFRNDPEVQKALQLALDRPSIYDTFLQVLAKRGFAVPKAVLDRPKNTQHERNDDLVKVFAQIYEKQDQHYDLYLACEKLIDLDEKIVLWRYRHVAMVERMIGNRRGTGGSSGVKYLSQTLSIRFFPEIWDVRNLLGNAYGRE